MNTSSCRLCCCPSRCVQQFFLAVASKKVIPTSPGCQVRGSGWSRKRGILFDAHTHTHTKERERCMAYSLVTVSSRRSKRFPAISQLVKREREGLWLAIGLGI